MIFRNYALPVSFLLLLTVLCVSGCSSQKVIPVELKRADTIVTLVSESSPGSEANQNNTDFLMGLQLCDYFEFGGESILYASGCMPDEHRTYVFMYPAGTTAHPWPDFDRKIWIAWDADAATDKPVLCQVKMILEQGWQDREGQRVHEAYSGSAVLSIEIADATVSTELTVVRMTRVGVEEEVLILSGKVVGEIIEPRYSKLGTYNVESFQYSWDQAVSETGDALTNKGTPGGQANLH